MRIKIGKSTIRGGELAGGLGVGTVAAQVGAGAVDLLHRAYDSITAKPLVDPDDLPNGGRPPLIDPDEPGPGTAKSTNPFSDPNFGSAPATAAPAKRTSRLPASPNPFSDPDFGK